MHQPAVAGRRFVSHDLVELLQRKRWQVFAKLLAFPPRARVTKFVLRRESVAIQCRSNVTWRSVRERVVCEQAIDFMRPLKQSVNQCHEPRVFAWRSQCGEPHLPIESRLVRRTPTGGAFYVTWLPFEFVRQPVNPIRAAFEDDFATVLRHYAEKAIAVDDAKCFELFVKISQHARWSTPRFKCAEE